MNSFDFKAVYRSQGLLISGHVHGPRSGRPYLVPTSSDDPQTAVFRLEFRPDTDVDTGGLDYLVPKPPSAWRKIRILLPGSQEFIIHSRR
jgi:hypothetical protein